MVGWESKEEKEEEEEEEEKEETLNYCLLRCRKLIFTTL